MTSMSSSTTKASADINNGPHQEAVIPRPTHATSIETSASPSPSIVPSASPEGGHTVVVPKISSVLVYCSARDDIPEKFFDATVALADTLVKNDIDVVYGGGSTGLMGQLADSVVDNGGRITGISPQFFRQNHSRLTKLIRCQTMHERKTQMMSISDCVVVLPGGLGTLDELAEALCWRKLNLIYQRPIIILNIDGFWDPLLEMLTRMEQQNFLSREESDWIVITDPSQIMDAIQRAEQQEKSRMERLKKRY